MRTLIPCHRAASQASYNTEVAKSPCLQLKAQNPGIFADGRMICRVAVQKAALAVPNIETRSVYHAEAEVYTRSLNHDFEKLRRAFGTQHLH